MTATDGNGQDIYDGNYKDRLDIKPSRFDANEVMTITIPGLMCEGAQVKTGPREKTPGGSGMADVNFKGDKIMINVSLFGTERLMQEFLYIKGNVNDGRVTIKLNMTNSTVKQS